MMFYPRAKRKDICDGADPTIQCSRRRQESNAGTFYWDARRQGYCSTELTPGPWGIPILLDSCVYCNELLPGTEARRRWEAKLDAERLAKAAPEQPTDMPAVGEMDVIADGDDGN